MAPKFDVESLGPGGRYAVERVAEITGVDSSSRVLELGAGHGIAGIHLAETRQCRVVATDIDMDKLERLQMRAMSLRLEGLIDVGPLDCTKTFPHSSESFDLVMAGSVLDRTDAMHIPIGEAFRVLRPGGRFAVADIVLLRPIAPEWTSIVGLWTGCMSGALLDTDYLDKLTAAGFSDPSVQVTRDYSRDDLAGFGPNEAVDQLEGAFASAFIRATKG